MKSKEKIWKYLILYFFLYAYHFIVEKFPGDDEYFSKISNQKTIIEWLYSRYMDWSSRIFPDAMAYLLLDHKVWLWRLFNPLLLIFLAAAMARIWKRKITLLEILAVLSILGFFAQNVLSSGVFWITGSMNYLWPITLGLLVMVPFADKIFRNLSLNNNFLFTLYLLLASLASVGNEQVSLCISCFAILSHIVLLAKKQSLDRKLLAMTIVMILGTSIMLLAPGNEERWIQEAAYWYPGFENLTLKEHLYLGTIWAFGKIFYDMRFLVFLGSFITIITCFQSEQLKNHFIFKIFTISFTGIIIINLTGLGQEWLISFTNIKDFDFSANLLSFYKMNKPFILALFPYIFWIIYSLMLGYLMIKSTKYKIFVSICLLAFIATLAVMFFSPTIYGSGNRVLTAGSVILGLVIAGELLEKNWIRNPFYLSILACFPIMNLGYMLLKWMRDGFNPFL
ncbi:DUF6056 family protein [Neobacillus muris]|uniref:DUF6056 family protein n=1 Tax=Neobacillus muris TaxID=2941334 RepID=UPI00204010C1|nr:DUF6056 family protein [Neobacillus muris]